MEQKRLNTQEKRETKKQIRDVAIDLFSQRGYNVVSIRDIAKAVGIKESSIYSHYKGKDDIMNAIIEFLISEFNPDPDQVPLDVALHQTEPEEFIIMASRSTMERLKTPHIRKICRLMCIELFHNDKILAFFRDKYIAPSYQIWQHIFQTMMDQRYILNADAQLLATEYVHYYVYLFFDAFIIRYDETSFDTLMDDVIDKLITHVRFLFEIIRKHEKKQEGIST